MKKTKPLKPEQKALNYLIRKGWVFDEEDICIRQLGKAFNEGNIASAIKVLIDKGWQLTSMGDIRVLNEALKIYIRQRVQQ